MDSIFFIMVDWRGADGRTHTNAWLSGVTQTSGSVATEIKRSAQRTGAQFRLDGAPVDTAQVLNLFGGR